ncbi:unnamed protein product [Brassica oleracea var. botrytis]
MAMKPAKSTGKSPAPSILMTSHQASRIGTPIPINPISGRREIHKKRLDSYWPGTAPRL